MLVLNFGDIFSIDTYASNPLLGSNFPHGSVLMDEVISAFHGLEECKLPCGKSCLLEVAFHILINPSVMDLNAAANKFKVMWCIQIC